VQHHDTLANKKAVKRSSKLLIAGAAAARKGRRQTPANMATSGFVSTTDIISMGFTKLAYFSCHYLFPH
jgi:hypothetical protein